MPKLYLRLINWGLLGSVINTLKILLVPLLLCFVLFQGIVSVYQGLDAPNFLHVNDSQFIISDSLTPPTFEADKAEHRILPDNWLRSMSGFGGSGWYRMQIPAQNQGGHVWGLFIPRANMNVAVFLNGHELGHSGHFSEPVSRNWARPLYYTIPAGLLSGKINILHIHLKSYDDEAGGLSELLIGEHDKLWPLYQMRNFIQIDIAKITFFMNIFAGFLALFLWHLRRQDTVYVWFSVICFSSSLFILNNFLLEIPVSRNIWHFSVYIAIGWFACSLLLFTLHFLQKNNRRREHFLLIYMLISSIVILLWQNIFVALAWHIGSLVMASYACLLLFRSWFQSQESTELVLAVAMLSTLALGFHDWYTRLTLQQFSSPVLMHLGPPVMLMAIAWILMVRFVRTLQENERFNVELEHRVATVKQALNEEHQRVQVLLEQEAKSDERQRIMKDLHDGLGGYLMSAHSIARIQALDGGIQQSLNDALFWLRTSIDTLDSEDDHLESLLGTFRYRIEPQLKSCGIHLFWHMDDISGYKVSSDYKLHVIRIVQEAITNVIKHANASELSIHIQLQEEDGMMFSIKDNGCGVSGDKVGHGLNNMRERIKDLGGTMNILSSLSGTCLSFVIPVLTEQSH